MLDLVRRLKRRLDPAGRQPAPPAWQRVTAGPLSGLEFFLPRDFRPRGWVARILDGRYETALLEELADLAAAGGVLYDVGGHAGVLSCAWLRLGGGRVEVFEPMPQNAARLAETLARNGLDAAVRLHRLALADFDGFATLVQNEKDIGLASMSHLESLGGVPKMGRQATNTRVEVEVRRLDTLAAELDLPVPAAVKIDIEGGEAAMAAGARRFLERHLPILFCEIHSIPAAVELGASLARLGYAPRRVEAAAASDTGGMPVYRFDPPPDSRAAKGSS